MSVDLKGKQKAAKAYRDIHASHGSVLNALDSVWHWLNGVTDSTIGALGGTLSDGFKTASAAFSTFIDGYADLFGLFGRLYNWVMSYVFRPLRSMINTTRQKILATLANRVRFLEGLIFVVAWRMLAVITAKVNAEADARIKAVRLAESRARQEDTALHQVIEREASSAYQVEHDTRVSTIKKLLDFAVTRNPELRFAVGEVTDVLLGLLSVDNPLARLAVGFIVKDLIDRLGVDSLVGSLADDMIGPLLGDPKPANVHDVIKDLSARIAALENFAATFTTNGGSQVEQAGSLWRDITSPVAAAGIVGFTATAVVDPTRWASEVSGILGTAGNDIVSAVAKLVKEA